MRSCARNVAIGVALAMVPAAAAARSPGVARLASTLSDLGDRAVALDRRAAAAPAPQLDLVTDEERGCQAALEAARAALDALAAERPRPVDQSGLGQLADELEVAWSALRDFASARHDHDRARMRDAAQSLRWAAATALDLLASYDDAGAPA